MKMSKEYILFLLVGLFLFAYVLDLVVKPLRLTFTSPYSYFNVETITSFPFSMTSIFIKSIALIITPLWLMSFFEDKGYAKPIILLIWSALSQLYAIQDIATKTRLIPLEWSLALALSGAILLAPTVWLFIRAALYSAHSSLTNAKMDEAIRQAQEKAKKEEIKD